jgi:hypothetical protein
MYNGIMSLPPTCLLPRTRWVKRIILFRALFRFSRELSSTVIVCIAIPSAIQYNILDSIPHYILGAQSEAEDETSMRTPCERDQ